MCGVVISEASGRILELLGMEADECVFLFECGHITHKLMTRMIYAEFRADSVRSMLSPSLQLFVLFACPFLDPMYAYR